MISSQKDRVIILGGSEGEEKSSVVEEIDFIKRNGVQLAPMRVGRANPSAFLVNDAIYVFGGSGNGLIGERYILSGNKWREVKPKNLPTITVEDDNAFNKFPEETFGPASLLYE